jgi:hypothetical protein
MIATIGCSTDVCLFLGEADFLVGIFLKTDGFQG